MKMLKLLPGILKQITLFLTPNFFNKIHGNSS